MVFSIKNLSLTTIFSIFAFSLIFFSATNALINLPQKVTFPAILIFGDSILDTGNNDYIKTVGKCNFPPYGAHIKLGPSGRFSDGKVPSDLIAEEMGIKELVPPYLDPNLQPEDLVTGVSFASGGSGYDPLTPKLAAVLSFPEQVALFKEYVTKLQGIVGEERKNFILANSLFVVSSSSNDLATTYLVRKVDYDLPSYTDLLINEATNFYNEIYTLGARRIAVFGAPPVGCVPFQRTLQGGIVRDCGAIPNQGAQMFNKKLNATLDSLNSKLDGAKFVHVDSYDLLYDMVQNPSKYGFQESTKGCCGTGYVEVSFLCNPKTPTVCANASSYVFWDSYHPTEQAYRTIVSTLLPEIVKKFS